MGARAVPAMTGLWKAVAAVALVATGALVVAVAVAVAVPTPLCHCGGRDGNSTGQLRQALDVANKSLAVSRGRWQRCREELGALQGQSLELERALANVTRLEEQNRALGTEVTRQREQLGEEQSLRAANESRELGDRLERLERLRERLESDRDELRRELARARGDSRRDNASLASCRQRAASLDANVTALGDELVALRSERAELAGDKVTLREEVARGAQQARELRRRLQEALEQQRELRERGERCEARQSELQDALRDYAAELEALRRRGRDRGSGRRCPPSRKG